jgi:hypothetical protein
MFCRPGGLGLFSAPATETLQADSRAVLYCPEDERLTFVVWVVVVEKSDSPQQSLNTNAFNNHYEVQWSSPVVQTSARDSLISMRTFAVAKCLAWLGSKVSTPRL